MLDNVYWFIGSIFRYCVKSTYREIMIDNSIIFNNQKNEAIYFTYNRSSTGYFTPNDKIGLTYVHSKPDDSGKIIQDYEMGPVYVDYPDLNANINVTFNDNSHTEIKLNLVLRENNNPYSNYGILKYKISKLSQ